MLYPFELRAHTSVFISLPALVAPEAVQNLDMPQKLEPTGAFACSTLMLRTLM